MGRDGRKTVLGLRKGVTENAALVNESLHRVCDSALPLPWVGVALLVAEGKSCLERLATMVPKQVAVRVGVAYYELRGVPTFNATPSNIGGVSGESRGEEMV
jgi:hypothetical protein